MVPVKPCHRAQIHREHSYILAREVYQCPGNDTEPPDMYYNRNTGCISTRMSAPDDVVLPGGRVTKDLFPKLFEAIEGNLDG